MSQVVQFPGGDRLTAEGVEVALRRVEDALAGIRAIMGNFEESQLFLEEDREGVKSLLVIADFNVRCVIDDLFPKRGVRT